MPATVTYSSIKINNVEVSLSGKGKVSFTAPYNAVDITFKSNVALDTFQIRVTPANVDYDIDKGAQAVYRTNISANTNTTVSLPVNSTIFAAGNGSYRVSLYARSAVDYMWDVTYLFMCLDLNGNAVQFNPVSTTGMEVFSGTPITKA